MKPTIHLTPREKQVLQLLQSLSERDIADKLAISINTVKFHIKNAYSKFPDAHNLRALIKEAGDHGLL